MTGALFATLLVLAGQSHPVAPQAASGVISRAAQAGLDEDAARSPAGPTMADRRGRAEAIQQEMGRDRMARDGVTMDPPRTLVRPTAQALSRCASAVSKSMAT